MPPWWHDDTGTVLVLAVGLVVVALLAVVAVTDASALFLARRAVVAQADAAALAGAQGADLSRVYAGGARGTLPLDPVAVRARVLAALRAARAAGAPPLHLDLLRCDGTTVTVRLSTRVRPPFRSWLGPQAGGVTVVAEAAATTALR